ncbi:hypothetical protein K490DRAFT_62436 [Saccharata proteae CBS 121410]|uniref:Thioesterase/thiol ester dehydrase-isomerase n=1 Tax=Saccharata proteae CBS 121410 TaxID=1314787 RepID=A0A9P4HXM2_9PEZI|nr:hypothetical protein K490DRAFT_62436 [Saccharata proteae CBS 121410]
MSSYSLRLALRRSRHLSPRVFTRSLSQAPDLSAIIREMPKRQPTMQVSMLPYEQSLWLQNTLAGFIPDSLRDRLEDYPLERGLPPAHHLIYFNPVRPADELLSDGTDPTQSPGEPFVRRMWAGGYVRFANPLYDEKSLMYQHYGACREKIRDVTVKGKKGEEKVFVGIERRFISGEGVDDLEILERELSQKDENEMGAASVVERRNIVFMRERSPEEAKKAVEEQMTKMLKPQHKPEFEHTFIPTQSLLFRFSALTFNAHRIHLDREYCRTVEGHRDLLVHGPLSLTMLLTILQDEIPETSTYIDRIDYRNLAPLYCNEPVRLCGRRAPIDPKSRDVWKYDLWVETPAGGIAVKATATVKSCYSDDRSGKSDFLF